MKYKNKGFTVIYIFFLIALVLSFGTIVLNKQSYLEKNLEFSQIQETLLKNILTNATLSINYDLENNSSGGLYKPILSCPLEVNYFSGETLLSTGQTFFENNTCSGSLAGEILTLYYTGDYINFGSGILSGTGFELIGENILTGSFSQYQVSFEKPTTFDDRFIKARTQIEGIITKETGYQNIFWSNKKVSDFIDTNTNNTGNFLKLSSTSSGILYFDISDSFSGKIIEFDKNIFDNQDKLLKINEINFLSDTGALGYLQEDLSFSGIIGSPKIFDFETKNYAIFLSYNIGILDNIRYTLKVFSDTGTGVYINSLKDDYLDKIEYLGNNIIINNGQYQSKIYKIDKYK